ncbi:hypothetical protein, partial [Streptomyces sp. NPDC001274]
MSASKESATTFPPVRGPWLKTGVSPPGPGEEQAPEVEVVDDDAVQDDHGPVPLLLSAADDDALRAQAGRLS